MRTDVERFFNGFIGETFKDRPDLKLFFHNHERKQLCIDNLCSQITRTELMGAVKLNGTKYVYMIREVAKLFCQQALKAAEQGLMSDSEKKRLEHEAFSHERLSEEIKEMEKDKLINITD